MRYLENRQLGMNVERGPVKAAAFKMELERRNNNDTVCKAAVGKAKAVKKDSFIGKALIGNHFHTYTLLKDMLCQR